MTSGLLEWGQSGNYNAIDDRGVIGALAGFRPNGLTLAPTLGAGTGLVVNIGPWSAVVDCGDGTRAVIGNRSAGTITETAGGASSRTDYLWVDLQVDPGTWSLSIVTSIPARTGVLLGTITVPASAATAAAMTFTPAPLAGGTKYLTAQINQTGSYQTVFSFPVGPGLWRVRGLWQGNTGGGAAPVWMSFGGPAGSNSLIVTRLFYGTAVWTNVIPTGLGGVAGPTVPSSQGFTWDCDGLIVVAAAGNLIQQMRGNGTNSWNIQPWSWLACEQVG
jgi:hypothetical protein